MADTIQSMQFKRGTKLALETVLKDAQKPLAGEPIWETDTNKIKIGDGTKNYIDLPYFGGSTDIEIYIVGYYLNNEFYTDSTYQTKCEHNNEKIYINLNSSQSSESEDTGIENAFYKYYGDSVGFKSSVGLATDVKPGIMKLYQTHGQNTDGTMSQKTITDGVNSIKFALETSADEDGDGEPENILVLDLPWD